RPRLRLSYFLQLNYDSWIVTVQLELVGYPNDLSPSVVFYNADLLQGIEDEFRSEAYVVAVARAKFLPSWAQSLDPCDLHGNRPVHGVYATRC
ncbi:MAG: hypothetical protein RR547_13940, partial [Raoultibacter sp.]